MDIHWLASVMIIRKVSIGPDYKGGAMHYMHGQPVLNGAMTIYEIRVESSFVSIWVKNERGEIIKWKSFNSTMPIAIEYNLEF